MACNIKSGENKGIIPLNFFLVGGRSLTAVAKKIQFEFFDLWSGQQMGDNSHFQFGDLLLQTSIK